MRAKITRSYYVDGLWHARPAGFWGAIKACLEPFFPEFFPMPGYGLSPLEAYHSMLHNMEEFKSNQPRPRVIYIDMD